MQCRFLSKEEVPRVPKITGMMPLLMMMRRRRSNGLTTMVKQVQSVLQVDGSYGVRRFPFFHPFQRQENLQEVSADCRCICHQ